MAGLASKKKHLFLQHFPVYEKVEIQRCGKSDTLVIAVYPNLEFSLSGEMGYGGGTHKKAMTGSKAKSPDTDEGELPDTSFSISAKQSYDGKDIEFKQELKDLLGDFDWVPNLVDGVFESVKASTGGVCELSFDLPKIALEGTWGYEDDDETLRVSRKGKITVKAEPLLGLTFAVDLFKLGLAAAGLPPQIMEIPEKIKTWSGDMAEVKLEMKAFAKGAVGFSFEKELEKDSGFSLKTDTSLQLGVLLVAEAGLSVWIVTAKASGEASGSAKFKLQLNLVQLIKPEGSATIMFDGLTLEFEGAVEAGLWSTTSSKKYKKTYTPIHKHEVWQRNFPYA